MNTGKVEFAPDYKSKAQMKRVTSGKWEHPVVTAAHESARQVEVERSRLEREVIEKAMARHHAETDYWEAARRGAAPTEEGALHQANCDLRVATLALDDFESKQKED